MLLLLHLLISLVHHCVRPSLSLFYRPTWKIFNWICGIGFPSLASLLILVGCTVVILIGCMVMYHSYGSILWVKSVHFQIVPKPDRFFTLLGKIVNASIKYLNLPLVKLWIIWVGIDSSRWTGSLRQITPVNSSPKWIISEP